MAWAQASPGNLLGLQGPDEDGLVHDGPRAVLMRKAVSFIISNFRSLTERMV